MNNDRALDQPGTDHEFISKWKYSPACRKVSMCRLIWYNTFFLGKSGTIVESVSMGSASSEGTSEENSSMNCSFSLLSVESGISPS